VNRFFLVLVAMTLLAFGLTAYRELAGLGPVSGMNDAYGWGIWKTFNVMVLTALGSGAFAVGIAAWVFPPQAFALADENGSPYQLLGLRLWPASTGIGCGPSLEFLLDCIPVEMEHAFAARGSCDLHVDLRHDSPAVENIPPVLERLGISIRACGPG